MPRTDQRTISRLPAAPAPWSVAGGPDPDFDDATRAARHALLTDPHLLMRFRGRFSGRARAPYDEMVRALGCVWDCPHDGAANATGYRCSRCGRTRAEAGD